MLEFREINISDRDWINGLLEMSDFMGCEYTFANDMAWRRLSDSLITRYKDFYISCFTGGNRPIFVYPSGSGNITDVISEMKKVSDSAGHKLTITSVNKENLKKLQEIYGNDISVTCNPDSYDYIYNSYDLIEMKGKKFHGKRNHINRFKENDWEFCELSEEHFADCINFAAESYNSGGGYDSFSAICEQYAINTYFNYYRELDLKGGILKANGKMVGFTIGERLNSNTFVVHIEKADPDVNGAYPTICSEFARKFAGGFEYINREEDMGIEGLRRSKRSYNPVFLLEKFTVTFNK